jgi:hypothetical protein
MWVDSPLMQSGAVPDPQHDPNDLQYWLNWDQLTDGTAFSTEPSSLDGLFSNIDGNVDNSVNTSPSTLFADVFDSPKFNSATLNTNANNLFPRSGACNDDDIFDFGSFYRDRSRQTSTPAQRQQPISPTQRYQAPAAQMITSVAPEQLQAPRPQLPTAPHPAPQPISRTDSEETQYDDNESDYAESRRSSISASPPPRARPTKKKRSSLDASISNGSTSPSKRSKRPGSVVDKKYRDKLKDKMAELKRTVPTVRAALDGEGGENGDGVAGLMPASNSRKPTILTKAIEYIHYLEDKNESLAAQLAHVRPAQTVG